MNNCPELWDKLLKQAPRIPFGGARKFEGFTAKPQPEVVGIDW